MKWKSLRCVHSLQPHGLHSWGNSPGKNTGLGNLSLLQGILWTQGLNPGLPHYRWILNQQRHWGSPEISSVQFSSVTEGCLTLCDPMNWSMPGLPVHHQFLEFTQNVHWVTDDIQPSHPLSSLLLLPSIFPSIRVFPNESAINPIHQCNKKN